MKIKNPRFWLAGWRVNTNYGCNVNADHRSILVLIQTQYWCTIITGSITLISYLHPAIVQSNTGGRCFGLVWYVWREHKRNWRKQRLHLIKSAGEQNQSKSENHWYRKCLGEEKKKTNTQFVDKMNRDLKIHPYFISAFSSTFSFYSACSDCPRLLRLRKWFYLLLICFLFFLCLDFMTERKRHLHVMNIFLKTAITIFSRLQIFRFLKHLWLKSSTNIHTRCYSGS